MRRSPEHALEMRQQIMEGASRAFLANGFRAASVPQIAAEAGVSVGLIYRYFPSKEELLLAVCHAETEQQLSELAAGLADIDDPRQRLRAAVELFVRSLVDEHWGPIVLHAWTEADRNPRLRAMLQRLCDSERGFAAIFIREAILRGEVRADLDVEALSLAAAMLLHGAIGHQAEQAAGFDPDAAVHAITTLLAAPLTP